MKETPQIRRENLMKLVKQYGQAEVARRVQKPDRQIGDILARRKSFGEKIARSIEKAWEPNAPTGWLDMDGGGAPESLEMDNIVSIPEFDAAGSMGGGLVLHEQPGVIQTLRVSREWLEKNVSSPFTSVKNLSIVTGFGDSMQPMFNPGDPLLLDNGVKTADSDGTYFFRIGDEGFIKRLQRIPGVGILVISENKAYRDWSITKDMDFEIFGRILKVWCSQDV